MKNVFIPIMLAGLMLSACSSAYKTAQTPDDVYFSPAPEGYVQQQRQQQEREDAYYSRNTDDGQYQSYFDDGSDRYLRMKVQNRSRWGTIDDYAYWNGFDPYYSYGYANAYAYNPYNVYYGYNSWTMNPYRYSTYSAFANPYRSSFYNPYFSMYSPWMGYGYNAYGYSPYSYGNYYGSPVTYYAEKNPVRSVNNQGRTPSSLNGYRNTNYDRSSNNRATYRNNNTSSSSGGSYDRGGVRTSQPTYTPSAPTRTFEPSTPSTPSSSGGSSSGSSSGSAGSSSRGGRG